MVCCRVLCRLLYTGIMENKMETTLRFAVEGSQIRRMYYIGAIEG